MAWLNRLYLAGDDENVASSVSERRRRVVLFE